ncbi:MAG: methyl-accepting chemotaxis protein [Clostridia bacterium]|nr:methyl-accepting chemotaxis protein [Clostridia bacterium]
MKLKTRITLMSVLPLILLGIVAFIVMELQVNDKMADEAYTGLRAAALATRNAIELEIPGEYHLDENNELWKGDTLNISQSMDIADLVKKETGIDITVFYEDTRFMTSVIGEDGKRAIGTQASDKVIEEVLNKGNDYSADHVDVAGTEYFVYYVPLYQDGTTDPIGMVFAGKSQEAVEAEITQVTMTLLGAVILCVIVFGALAIYSSNNIVTNLKKSISVVEAVSTGNLAVTMDNRLLKRKDEVGEIARYIQKLRDDLLRIIGNLKQQSSMLYGTSSHLDATSAHAFDAVGQVERAIHEIADGATSQADETQKATENVIYMGNLVENTTADVDELYNNASAMQKSSEEASSTLGELNEINKKAKNAIDIIYEQTNTTNESALKIREATNLITAIADETNLLSLNASIEAARAGEQGRGFAVVAAQIQKLAEQSNESARQIEQIIVSLIQDSTKAVETMDEVREIMERQSENVERTEHMFEQVKVGIDKSISGVNSIAEKTRNLDEARVNVVDVVQNLTAIAQENAAGTEETSASTTEFGNMMGDIQTSSVQLKDIANGLDENMKVFKTE